MSKYKDVPKASTNMFTESDDKVMHVTLPLSEETMLNGSDNSLVYQEMVKDKTFTLIIHTDSKEEVDRIHEALSQNGQVIVPVAMTFWGSYYGQCIDKYGISWKITMTSEDQRITSIIVNWNRRKTVRCHSRLALIGNREFN